MSSTVFILTCMFLFLVALCSHAPLSHFQPSPSSPQECCILLRKGCANGSGIWAIEWNLFSSESGTVFKCFNNLRLILWNNFDSIYLNNNLHQIRALGLTFYSSSVSCILKQRCADGTILCKFLLNHWLTLLHSQTDLTISEASEEPIVLFHLWYLQIALFVDQQPLMVLFLVSEHFRCIISHAPPLPSQLPFLCTEFTLYIITLSQVTKWYQALVPWPGIESVSGQKL